MAKILVAGLINIETTLKIEGFPLAYVPVRYPFHGINSTVSGVGYNIAKALTTLGNHVDFLSLIGTDINGEMVRAALAKIGVSDAHILSQLTNTAQSVILYDEAGTRMIHTDLKDIQEQAYPPAQASFVDVDLAVLCNINFSRPLLERAQQAHVPIACDVHVISDLEDAYNSDYMAAATILFQSHEGLPTTPEDWARQIQKRYGTPLIGIGMGAQGALLAVKDDNAIEHMPARTLRPIVNTIGGGDALFSAFVHSYAATQDPYLAMRKAVLFAGYKIGGTSAAEGFMSAQQLEDAYAQAQS